ncbi:DnaB-like helicase C-terminal domain-containing protein [Akkermansiaceae bacterium]|nr:DnaB-like helicase C-terminal domain-containing protein [Akkermansiaceae bacterium]
MSQSIQEHATDQEPAGDETALDPALAENSSKHPAANTVSDAPEATDVKSLVQNALERCQGLLFCDVASRGLSTGLSLLDEMSNGLEPGRVYLIAARPSMGKTSLLLQILAEVCLKQQIPSLFFTGDLSVPEVIDRLVFNRAMAPLHALTDPAYTPNKGDLMRIQKSAHELAGSGLILDGIRDLTIEAIAAKARDARAEAGLGFIVIDHLHLIRSESTPSETSRKRETVRVIHEIRNLALELGLPILVSAHLKRRAEGRLPRIGDIREAGAIEHEADFIGLLHREPPITDEECVELLVAKNNNGPPGAIRLFLTKEIQRFEEGPVVPNEEQEMIRAWRNYKSEKNFPWEGG